MNRYLASAYHFLGSALVLFLVFALVRWVWYPGLFFSAAHGVNLLGIIIPVDLIIGPLITLIIFNPAKKAGLKRDMAVIFAAQVAFMLYGLFTIYSARPVYVSLVDKDFYLVTANEIEPQDQQKAKDPQFRTLPNLGPDWVVSVIDDKKLRADLTFSNAFAGVGAQNLPEYFKPYQKELTRIKEIAKPANKLPELKKEQLQSLQNFADAKQKSGTTVSFIRLYAKSKIFYVAIDSKTGQVIEMI
jgi:hypothetical protein